MKKDKRIKKTPGRIGLNKRIAMKCLDCAGSAKEITLCHLFDCPLWTIRFGYTMQNKQYLKRMKTAEKNYHEDFKELQKMGIDIEDFYKNHSPSVFPADFARGNAQDCISCVENARDVQGDA